MIFNSINQAIKVSFVIQFLIIIGSPLSFAFDKMSQMEAQAVLNRLNTGIAPTATNSRGIFRGDCWEAEHHKAVSSKDPTIFVVIPKIRGERTPMVTIGLVAEEGEFNQSWTNAIAQTFVDEIRSQISDINLSEARKIKRNYGGIDYSIFASRNESSRWKEDHGILIIGNDYFAVGLPNENGGYRLPFGEHLYFCKLEKMSVNFN